MNFSPGMTSGQEGVDCLRTIVRLSPDTKVIFMTAYGGVETAVKAIKEGASGLHREAVGQREARRHRRRDAALQPSRADREGSRGEAAASSPATPPRLPRRSWAISPPIARLLGDIDKVARAPTPPC